MALSPPDAPGAAEARDTSRCDVAVVGAGIVGLATTWTLVSRRPGAEVVVLDKEAGVARHQSGRNSGVLHSGLYYAPGSLKARLCRRGSAEMLRFCAEHGIPARVTGKLVVATKEAELPGLARLEQRGLANGLTITRLDADGARRREPHVAALAALEVAETGVVDFAAVCRRLAGLLCDAGVEIRTGAEVVGIERRGGRHRLRTRRGDVLATTLVNCAGLHSDRVAGMGGAGADITIVAFRGEYHEVRPPAAHLVRGLVYPVPDPDFPFLGVHLTRGVDDVVHAGPNAVLALAREGYRGRDVSAAELRRLARNRGLWRLARRHARQGAAEVWRSLWRPAFVAQVQRLVPEITSADLVRAPAGVRAQAMSHDGALLDDFCIEEGPGALHVLNAPSPAATSAFAIADEIVRRVPPSD